MPVKKIAHYIRGAAGRGDEGTETGTLLHFSKGSATEIAGDCALRQEVARWRRTERCRAASWDREVRANCGRLPPGRPAFRGRRRREPRLALASLWRKSSRSPYTSSKPLPLWVSRSQMRDFQPAAFPLATASRTQPSGAR